jgi:hypothetical protein
MFASAAKGFWWSEAKNTRSDYLREPQSSGWGDSWLGRNDILGVLILLRAKTTISSNTLSEMQNLTIRKPKVTVCRLCDRTRYLRTSMAGTSPRQVWPCKIKPKSKSIFGRIQTTAHFLSLEQAEFWNHRFFLRFQIGPVKFTLTLLAMSFIPTHHKITAAPFYLGR